MSLLVLKLLWIAREYDLVFKSLSYSKTWVKKMGAPLAIDISSKSLPIDVADLISLSIIFPSRFVNIGSCSLLVMIAAFWFNDWLVCHSKCYASSVSCWLSCSFVAAISIFSNKACYNKNVFLSSVCGQQPHALADRFHLLSGADLLMSGMFHI